MTNDSASKIEKSSQPKIIFWALFTIIAILIYPFFLTFIGFSGTYSGWMQAILKLWPIIIVCSLAQGLYIERLTKTAKPMPRKVLILPLLIVLILFVIAPLYGIWLKVQFESDSVIGSTYGLIEDLLTAYEREHHSYPENLTELKDSQTQFGLTYKYLYADTNWSAEYHRRGEDNYSLCVTYIPTNRTECKN